MLHADADLAVAVEGPVEAHDVGRVALMQHLQLPDDLVADGRLDLQVDQLQGRRAAAEEAYPSLTKLFNKTRPAIAAPGSSSRPTIPRAQDLSSVQTSSTPPLTTLPERSPHRKAVRKQSQRPQAWNLVPVGSSHGQAH